LKTGDSCAAIEAKYSITFAQFYAWNPAIGSDCTSLWVDEAYCVRILLHFHHSYIKNVFIVDTSRTNTVWYYKFLY
jgi:hypothetical protein